MKYPNPIVRALPLRERPLYRVQRDAGACNLVELLAAVVGGARQIEVAHDLLSRFGNLDGLLRAPACELESIFSVGPASAARLKAALELGRRIGLAESDEPPQVKSPADVAHLLMTEMAGLEQEHLRVLYLNTRYRLTGSETAYVGSLNATRIRAADVFREATRRNCAAIIVAHNHPSGDPSPSPEDVEVTRQLVAAGNLLDIELLDHLIIGGPQQFVSLRERGLGFAT